MWTWIEGQELELDTMQRKLTGVYIELCMQDSKALNVQEEG